MKTQTSIDDANLTNVAQVAYLLVNQLNAYPDDEAMKKWCLSTLSHACRHLEYFLVPLVSEKANAIAVEKDVAPLEKFGWRDQKTRMKDLDRRIFHLEHVEPVADLTRELLNLNPPTLESVKNVLAKAKVAWITKEEDACLTKKGLRCRRDSGGFAAYKEAGIKIMNCPKEKIL